MQDQNVTATAGTIDDKQLMTFCIQGLLRYGQELESVQGAEAMERITGLRDLTNEIISFWDLDGALFGEAAETE